MAKKTIFVLIDGEVFAPPTQGDDDESPTITLRVVNAD